MLKSMLFVGICVNLVSPGWAAQPEPGQTPPMSKKPNCFITVRRELHTGEKQTQNFELHKKTKADCAKAASAHDANFSPAAVAKKSVEFRWKP